VTARSDGYLPIGDYAAIGDGRAVALVGRDGAVDWWCMPNVDSPSVFGRLLDAQRGGAFELAPEEPFEVDRRYQQESNVLETTFRTASGGVRVTDALTLSDDAWISPMRELTRRIDGVAGEVRMRWRVQPRFGYGTAETTFGRRSGRHVVVSGANALALATWDAGETELRDGALAGDFTTSPGSSALISLAGSAGEPLVLSGRADTALRLERTERFWPQWTRRHLSYDGRWRELVLRSALMLKLLVNAPSGAIVAAPTTSLPEWIGGTRNWDYRFTWPRDAAYTLFSLLRLGCPDEARSFFWWLSHATQRTRPRLHPLYCVDGAHPRGEDELPLAGYRGSRPVRVGNDASTQLQLDVYGTVLEGMRLYAEETGELEAEEGGDVARMADWVAQSWRQPDSGIWEVRSEPAHFTQSKAMCWIALDRACTLAQMGLVPGKHAPAWRSEADAIMRFVNEECWDEERRSFVRSPSHPEVDASLLTLALYAWPDPGRVRDTVDAVRRELAVGPLVYRYRGDDGIGEEEGFFLPCSFWLVESLARTGRIGDAIELMDELTLHANDVGLYAEEAAADGSFLGNFPQALTHLALVNAAIAVQRAESGA
jgi:GH15 family glucan-1,4-alpha-glucosidase